MGLISHLPGEQGWGRGDRDTRAGMCDKIKALLLPGPHLGFT